jgi:hypothetical protein
MANRTVTVELQAKVAGFVEGMRTAEKETGDLNRELEDLGRHDREFRDLEEKTAGLTVSTKAAAAATDELGDQTGQSGEKMKRTAIDARFLSTELAKTRGEVLALAAAFAATGGQSDLDAFKQKKRYQSALERIERELKPGAGGEAAAQAAEVGSSLGRLIGLSANQSLKAALTGGIAGPVIAGALIPVAIELGVMVGGAMLTGVGLAGIGAGIAGQIQDARVESAARGLAGEVAEGFRSATGAFAQPLADVLFAARQEWQKLSVGIHTTMDYLAPEVRVLGAGLLGFVDNLVPGLERAAVAALPLVDTFSHWLPEFGAEFAGLLDTMAENSDDLNEGLKLVLGTLSAIVQVTSTLIEVASFLRKPAEWSVGTIIPAIKSLTNSGTKAIDVLDHTADSAAALAAAAAAASPSLEELSKRLNQTAMSSAMLAGQMTDKVINAMLRADEASLSLAESQTRLKETLKENGHAFDIHTAKGQANRAAILGVVRSNLQFYDTMIQSGYSAEQAAKSYDQNTAALEAQLSKAHFTKAEIQSLIGEYRNVPDKVNTEIAVKGLTDAINGLNDLLRQINGLPPRVTTVIETVHVDRFNRIAQRWGGVHYAADGLVSFGQAGVYSGGPVYGIAEPETGGEAFVPRNGDYARSMGILSEAASWYGASVQPLMKSRAAAGIWPAAGVGGGSGDDHSVHLTVQATRANLDYSELQAWQRNAEIRQRVGRPR